jgi:hypothetical protein
LEKGSGKQVEINDQIRLAEQQIKELDWVNTDVAKEREKFEEERKKILEDNGVTSDELLSQFNIDKESVYLLNISDDPSLSGCLMLVLKNGENMFGSGVQQGQQGHKVEGLGI